MVLEENFRFVFPLSGVRLLGDFCWPSYSIPESLSMINVESFFIELLFGLEIEFKS